MDFFILLLKFMFFVLIIEGYYILIYFLSSSFLSQVSHLATEFRLLLSRAPTNSFLFLIET